MFAAGGDFSDCGGEGKGESGIKIQGLCRRGAECRWRDMFIIKANCVGGRVERD